MNRSNEEEQRIFKEKMSELSPQEINTFLTNLNKYRLNRLKHIKLYNKYRKLHSEIVDSMVDYMYSDKYNMGEYFKTVVDNLNKEERKSKCMILYSDDIDDANILGELFIYKNHPLVKSVTEIYLEKNKFKNEEKVKLLNAMNNSYVSLFKVIEANGNTGYVTYYDVFSHKIFKVIDIALSSTYKPTSGKQIYLYNRIITIDDNISFGTGIHIYFRNNNKELQDFIKKHKYNKYSDFSRCIILYEISKKSNDINITFNYNY